MFKKILKVIGLFVATHILCWVVGFVCYIIFNFNIYKIWYEIILHQWLLGGVIVTIFCMCGVMFFIILEIVD